MRDKCSFAKLWRHKTFRIHKASQNDESLKLTSHMTQTKSSFVVKILLKCALNGKSSFNYDLNFEELFLRVLSCDICVRFVPSLSNVLIIHRTRVRLSCLLYRKHVIAKSFYCGNTLPSHWVARKRVHDRPFPCSETASVTLADRNGFLLLVWLSIHPYLSFPRKSILTSPSIGRRKIRSYYNNVLSNIYRS